MRLPKVFQKKIALLQSLNVEFKANLEQLDIVSGYHQKVIVAGYKSLKLIKYNKLDLTDGGMDSLTLDLMWHWTFDPRNGALRSGISSGDIHLIKSNSLRNQLFAWEDLVSDLNEDELQSREHQLGSLDLFSTYTRIANLIAIAFEKISPSAYLSDYAGLFGDPLFEDYLVNEPLI